MVSNVHNSSAFDKRSDARTINPRSSSLDNPKRAPSNLIIGGQSAGNEQAARYVDRNIQSAVIFPHSRPIKRRRRLSAEETRYLQEAFMQNQRPNSENRSIIANKLGLSMRAIQIWFQNRRAKVKKDAQDANPGLIFSSTSERVPRDEIFHAYKPPVAKRSPVNNQIENFLHCDSSSISFQELFGEFKNDLKSRFSSTQPSGSLNVGMDESLELDILLTPESPLKLDEKYFDIDYVEEFDFSPEMLQTHWQDTPCSMSDSTQCDENATIVCPTPIQPPCIDSLAFDNFLNLSEFANSV